MSQAERDRLVCLKKASEKLITRAAAAAELKVSERQIYRMLAALKTKGDKAVVHGLRGRSSNRRLSSAVEQEAVKILSQEVYRGFGPTLASKYLPSKHAITASKETVRQWMVRAGLRSVCRERIEQVHVWGKRRERYGELVQWDTSEHDWLEGRGEKIYLINMIDDASSRLFAPPALGALPEPEREDREDTGFVKAVAGLAAGSHSNTGKYLPSQPT